MKTFTLDLRHPGLARTGDITIKIDGVAVSTPASSQSVVLRRENRQKWSLGQAADPNTVRHDGAGLGDLYTGPVTIVYGTTDGSRVDTLRRAAQTFFAWRWSESIQLGVKIGDFLVKADSEVTEEDLRTRNLILIGDPAENKLTGKIADQIPIIFTNTTLSVAGQTFAGAGILLTYPNPLSPKHLVGVLTLPYDQSLLDSFAIVATFPPRIMTQGMFLNGDMPIRGYSTPDILVFDLRKPYGVDWNFNGNLSPRDLEFFGFDLRQVLWAGWFDRDWKLID